MVAGGYATWTSSLDRKELIPFTGTLPVFASNIQVVTFQNGQGVRSLAEYGQYPAPANNTDLFYHFQGLTSDGAYYIIAILPITAPGLAETSDAARTISIGGVAYPDMGDANADWLGYYAAAANLLNATAPEAFTPTLTQLDLLIQSMKVAQ